MDYNFKFCTFIGRYLISVIVIYEAGHIHPAISPNRLLKSYRFSHIFLRDPTFFYATYVYTRTSVTQPLLHPINLNPIYTGRFRAVSEPGRLQDPRLR